MEGIEHYDALPNPIAIYFGDFVPLILDRLSTSWVASDLDLHSDLIQVRVIITGKTRLELM